ncbi:MAG: aminotransferase class I/II-fold pyridoxal phosphate-dependent enzyme [Planctomycetota bacterium]|nr:aminotransferase class I/II-fold pyridoxal phosphate-dependent enzyme [Planctomycetota bacterium]
MDAQDPEGFRRAGRDLVDRLADYLAGVGEREGAVLAPQDPDELLARFATSPGAAPAADPAARLLELSEELLAHSNHVHHPGYVGHQVAAPLPLAALAELLNALLNNGMAIFEMGQLQTVLEHRVVGFLCAALGLPRGEGGAGGVLTHGGSLGNLTALLAARQAQLATSGHDVWTHGQAEPLAVLVSEQAHYCIARACGVMGWGSAGAQPVATDARFALDPADLPRALAAAEAAGRRVVAVVASACTTATGTFDPLPAIADFCDAHGLWLHVDGAHGASLALSPRHRHRVAGIERADSVVLDLHKLLGLPALNTAVLFRDEARSFEAFAQEASYLFQAAAPEEQWFNLGQRTLECTKRALGATAWIALEVHGQDHFADHVDRLVGLAQELADLVAAAPDFECAHAPEANILCFRYRPDLAGSSARGQLPLAELDALQARIRAKVVASGSHYLVEARLLGAGWLRVALMNPATERGDLEGLLGALRAAARG